ncbi:hypothetical protein AAFF_G00421570 [Aldrovandia affinis]|uniref:Uncharacterized protein n=1 Tax=Aldrovandia affinis TaxID=143900 RepID=A0AAD7S9T8_9TELE|nr:hypothetical protein AAFF_G00421570 [Aldrovandia affinis]
MRKQPESLSQKVNADKRGQKQPCRCCPGVKPTTFRCRADTPALGPPRSARAGTGRPGEPGERGSAGGPGPFRRIPGRGFSLSAPFQSAFPAVGLGAHAGRQRAVHSPPPPRAPPAQLDGAFHHKSKDSLVSPFDWCGRPAGRRAERGAGRPDRTSPIHPGTAHCQRRPAFIAAAGAVSRTWRTALPGLLGNVGWVTAARAPPCLARRGL